MNKYLLALTTTILITSASLMAAPVSTVLKAGAKSLDQVTGNLFQGNAKVQVKEGLENAIMMLNGGVWPKSEKEFEALFSFSSHLKKILAKDSKDLTESDIKTLLKYSTTEAVKYKKMTSYLPCTVCVCDELSDAGISFILKSVNKSTKEILSSMPENVAEVASKSIAVGNKVGYADLSRAVSEMSDTKKKLAFVYLTKMNSGTKQEKALGKALVSFSESKIGANELWMLMGDEVDNAAKVKWTEFFERMTREAKAKKQEPVAYMKEWMEKSSKNDGELSEALSNLKKKNCWKVW